MSRWRTPCLLFALLAYMRPAAALDVTGTVVDNRGTGLSNMPVQLRYYDSGSSTQSVVFTDLAGRFRHANVTDSWTLQVPAEFLNARGYFSISSQSGNGEAAAPMITRRLDFTHRIVGLLVNELGQPLLGEQSFVAQIFENNATFTTNVVTDAAGTFHIAATPAVWKLSQLFPSPGSILVFGEHEIEVPVTGTEKEITIAVPVATGTISVFTAGHGGRMLVLETEAFNTRFRLTEPISFPTPPVLSFRVFNGTWRVSVAYPEDRDPHPSSTPLPQPVIVSVTNETVSVVLPNTPSVSPPLYLQQVRVVTATGSPATNVLVRADASGSQAPSVPGSSEPPEIVTLSLPAGRTTLRASNYQWPERFGWDIALPITVASNQTNAEITMVVPEPGLGSRLHGTITATDGTPPPLEQISVTFRRLEGTTNYAVSLPVDALGRFGTNVPPGRWQIQTYAGGALHQSVVTVANQDVAVDFRFAVPASVPEIPVVMRTMDDTGARLTGNGVYQSLGGNGGPLSEEPVLVSPGVLDAQISVVQYYPPITPTYRLDPSLRWQLRPGTTASNLTLISRRTSTRIEGRLRDEQGRLLRSGYAAAWTSVDGTNYWASGSIASGYFSLNVFPGEWQVGADVSRYPALGPTGYPGYLPATPRGFETLERTVAEPPRFVRVTGDVTRCEFQVTNVTALADLTIQLVREDGGLVEGATLVVSAAAGYWTGTADINGRATLRVPPGAASFYVSPVYNAIEWEPVFWPSLQLDLQAPSNHVVLVARRSQACIPVLTDASVLGIQPSIHASAQVNGTNYSSTAQLDVDGAVCLPAFTGTWKVVPLVDYYSLRSPAPRHVTVPSTGPVAPGSFELQPLSADFRTARLLPPVSLPDGRLRLQLEVETLTAWRIERSSNLRDWTRVAIAYSDSGLLTIEDSPPEPRSVFYRAVWAR